MSLSADPAEGIHMAVIKNTWHCRLGNGGVSVCLVYLMGQLRVKFRITFTTERKEKYLSFCMYFRPSMQPLFSIDSYWVRKLITDSWRLIEVTLSSHYHYQFSTFQNNQQQCIFINSDNSSNSLNCLLISFSYQYYLFRRSKFIFKTKT